jgi:hypothetical protein
MLGEAGTLPGPHLVDCLELGDFFGHVVDGAVVHRRDDHLEAGLVRQQRAGSGEGRGQCSSRRSRY